MVVLSVLLPISSRTISVGALFSVNGFKLICFYFGVPLLRPVTGRTTGVDHGTQSDRNHAQNSEDKHTINTVLHLTLSQNVTLILFRVSEQSIVLVLLVVYLDPKTVSHIESCKLHSDPPSLKLM